MGDLGAFRTDAESICSQLKHEEKHLRLKRRWLMGLAESKSDRKQLKGPKFLMHNALPESLLREDDIFYETVTDLVQEAFGECDLKNRPHFSFDEGQFFDASTIEKILLSGLDDMTNKGLFFLAMILNRGSVNFVKSRSRMKKIIRELLPGVLSKRDNGSQVDILKHISQLLCNPHNFKKKHGVFSTFISLYHHMAARKVLKELEEMPYDTLLAMYRKLRGVQFDINMTPQKCGWNRDGLIRQVRKTCEKMLSELGNGDPLQEPLAKAMAVAGLSLNLTRGSQNLSLTEFYQFSPETKTLQEEIIRAILVLDTKVNPTVRFSELKSLQLTLDPNAEISNRSLRAAMRKMLVNFLFECNDTSPVPKNLLKALARVNKSSKSSPRRCLLQEEIEEDVECILAVSAQSKQVIWDMLPGHDFDKDFGDAYLENPEESDGDGINYNTDDNEEEQWRQEASSRNTVSGINSQMESTGDSMPHYAATATSAYKKDAPYPYPARETRISCRSVEVAEMDSVNQNSVVTSQLQSNRFDDTSDSNIDEQKRYTRDMCTPSTHGYRFKSLGLTHENSYCWTTEANELEYISAKDPIMSSNEKSTLKNQYLSIQEACDETSVLAFNLVGQLLHVFVQMEGIDVSCSDSLYLRGEYSDQDECRDATSTGNKCPLGKCMGGSALMQLLEERMPFLSKR